MAENYILAIIGSAGRKENADKVNKHLYDLMFEQVKLVMEEWNIDSVVSGGAAFSDHLAVRAFNEGIAKSLTLYLPAFWNGSSFNPNPKIQFNPGSTSNRLHKRFSELVEIDSLKEIQKAINGGARVEVFEGFHRRNTEVANAATHMQAFTFGLNVPPIDFIPEDSSFSKSIEAGVLDRGTADTWGKAWKCQIKRCVSLNWLERQMGTNFEEPISISRP